MCGSFVQNRAAFVLFPEFEQRRVAAAIGSHRSDATLHWIFLDRISGDCERELGGTRVQLQKRIIGDGRCRLSRLTSLRSFDR
jgi:hypothetical protein